MTEILLCGVPGSGKTTLGKKLNSQGLVHYIPSGERKKILLKKIGIRKKLSEMNQVESLLINALFFEKMLTPDEEYEFGNDWHDIPLLIDTHASYMLIDGSFVKLIPKNFNCEAVILLEAHPEVLVERRRARGRAKDFLSVDDASSEQEQESLEARSFAKRKNIPILEIDNTKDWQYTTIVEFIKQQREY